MGQFLSKSVEYLGVRICNYKNNVDLYDEIQLPEYRIDYFDDKKFYTVKI